MNALLQKASKVNQSGAISGRSLAYSHLTEAERVQGAADAATGTRRFLPSVKQAARLFGTTPAKVREELERRAAQQRREQVNRIAESIRCLPDHLRDLVVNEAGVAKVWDSIERLTR
jgi:hypothetical protein